MAGQLSALRLLLGLWAVQAAYSSQYLVVSRSANGTWSFQPADSISVNGKDKLRAVPVSEKAQAAWDSKAIGRQGEARLSEFTVIRRAADGTLIGRAGAGEWRLLLPEGAKAKVPEPAAQLWKESAVEFKKEHKDKTGEAIRLEDLCAILPGADASSSAASLATDISLHKMPGTPDDEAFRQLVAVIPPAVKAYPSGPAADTIRSYLTREISERLNTWRAGDAPVTVLDQSGALASDAQAAFPADSALTALTEQTRAARKWLDRRIAILRALDAGKQSDAFLLAYHEFEPFDQSFEALTKARTRHMSLSAAAHLDTARELRKHADYAGAIRQLTIAKWRDPKLAGADEFLEEVRLEAAHLSARKYAEARGSIDPRDPKQVQVQRKLLLAEQYLSDGKQAEAEATLHEAESIDPDEPRLALLHARLAIARGDLGRALAMLDNYAGTAPTPQDFAEGEKLRASVLYSIQKERAKTETKIPSDIDEQRFTSALETSAEGLKVDNESPQFLYYAGVSACILRNCDKAALLLRRYLDVTDSTQGDRRQRMAAIRILRETEALAPAAKDAGRRQASWFSGAALDRGVYYDPVSLSFQPKVMRVDASEHVSVNYEWSGNQLRSVHTKYEDKKTGSNIVKLALAGAAASQGIGSTVGWRTPDRETNDFYFSYYDDLPQIMKVSRDNVIVKSSRIPISIPGIGFPGMGMLGGIGALGSLRGLAGLGALRGKMGAGMPGLGGALPGMGGSFPGMAGLGGMRLGGMPGMGGLSSLMAARQFIPSQQYSIHSDPQGGSSAGYLTLWNNPRIDTRLAWKATGKRAAVGFSGNRFFHPFVWDGIHLFEFDYDDQGRVLHAWELGDPRPSRLDMTWDGQRLVKIVGHDGSPSGAVVYTRLLNYSGDRLTGETVTYEGKTSKVEYKYDKQGRLTEADCDADHSLDGRSRKVHFVVDKE
ncbi:MAG: hypothetical protein U0Q18_28530 [Bryobacteraceae bacterium]